MTETAFTTYTLIQKAIAKIDSGDLPPYYEADLRVFREILADAIDPSETESATLKSLKEQFATAIESRDWFRNTNIIDRQAGKSGRHQVLDRLPMAELKHNHEHLIKNGLPGLCKGIGHNLYHNYTHCSRMAQRASGYAAEFKLEFSEAEIQALKIGMVGHDSAHSGVLGPPDLEHNVQYAVKQLYLFMDYFGYSKAQIAYAFEKGVLPTVSFNSEFVPQDAIGVSAELGDLAFEIELPHFLSNSLNVLKEQIPSIIPPPPSVIQWLRKPVRDGFIGTYLKARIADLSKIDGTNKETFERLKKWMSHISTEITELADLIENGHPLPDKFQFFTEIGRQAEATISAQQAKISTQHEFMVKKVRRSIVLPTDTGIIPQGATRTPRSFLERS
ncbi:MAG: hypothetical protein MRY72_00900 [Aquisalinus sp.]|nr:hypothetical protein [Aquisalinus sp.]